MMNMLEEAIIYATVMHQGKVRKFGNRPFILHPLEVAQILSTIPVRGRLPAPAAVLQKELYPHQRLAGEVRPGAL